MLIFVEYDYKPDGPLTRRRRTEIKVLDRYRYLLYIIFNLLLGHTAACRGEHCEHVVRIVHACLELLKLSALEVDLGIQSRV